MHYKYMKLRGKITEIYGTASAFAMVLGLSKNSMSKKLNCKSGFSQRDIEKWAALLKIDRDDYSEYFFK